MEFLDEGHHGHAIGIRRHKGPAADFTGVPIKKVGAVTGRIQPPVNHRAGERRVRVRSK